MVIDKYYKRWGMPKPWFKSRTDWSFIETERKKVEDYIPPDVWNKLCHELLYSDDLQKAIAARCKTRPKHVRRVVAEVLKLTPYMVRFDVIGPTQQKILHRKLKKRQTQAQIARALHITRQQVSDAIARLEKKFKKSSGPQGGGIDTVLRDKTPKPIETKEDNPILEPKTDMKTYSDYMEGVRRRLRKTRGKGWWSK